MTTPPSIVALDHVQLAMPAGQEETARAFYAGLLGLPEVPKPPELAQRGGAWFETDAVKVHLGVDPDFHPSRKAHAAFRVRGLRALAQRLRDAGCDLLEEAMPGHDRCYVNDPFGNRLELLEPLPG